MPDSTYAQVLGAVAIIGVPGMLVGQIAGATVHWEQLPVYPLAELVGAVAAAFAYTAVSVARAATRTAAAPSAQPTPEGVRS